MFLKRPSLILVFMLTAAALLLAPEVYAAAPVNGTITPSSGSSSTIEQRLFTTTYTDADGWQNIRRVYLVVDTVKPEEHAFNCVSMYYHRESNTFCLFVEDGDIVTTQYAVAGSDVILENPYVQLDCRKSSASGSGNTLSVTWCLRFNEPYAGRVYNCYLAVKDEDELWSPWDQMGTWGVTKGIDRALWVWGMTKDIVFNTGTARTDFFSFCAAPHGDTNKKITLVFFDAKPWGVNLMDAANAAALRQFLREAHDNGLRIEFLSGDKLWSAPEYRAIGENLISEVTAFNAAGGASQRFNGIQFDVEPYLLKAKENSDPYDWNYDNGLLWNEYLALLTNCQAIINTYNTANTPYIRFGAAIPRWYSISSSPSAAETIDRIDYIAIMDYIATSNHADTVSRMISEAQDEINYANTRGKKVYIGVEASHPTDPVDFPPNSSFYEEGNTEMESVLTEVQNAFLSASSYAGAAVHYYEDLTGPKGKEISYRSLTSGANSYHYPIVNVLSPNRAGEVWVGSVNIQWSATDLDGDVLRVDVQYSTNGGTSWNTILGSAENSGNYLWNTSAIATGTNYLIKVSARDTSSRIGYDVSNNTFSIARTVTQTTIADLHLWNESSNSLRLKWTPPAYTPRSYRIYRSINGGSFTEISGSPFITVDKYIDTGLSNANKYKYQIRPIYGDSAEGNVSNPSNMLIPGPSFLIDYCEQNEGIQYQGPYGPQAPYLSYSFGTSNIKEGTKSMTLTYNYNAAVGGWGAVLKGVLPPVKVDISPYSAVKFWAKGGAIGGTAIKFQLSESGRSEGNETWESPAITISNPDWVDYKFNLSNFIRVDGAGNNRLDTHSIGGYGLAFASTTASGTYYVDEIRLITTDVIITVPPGPGPEGEYLFQPTPLVGTLANHRFVLGPIPVTFAGFAAPWTIRVWTNNNPSASRQNAPMYAGLKGADSATYTPLKVWCLNFGPTSNVPDEEDDALWRDYWLRVPEYNEMDPANVYTWRRLAWADAPLNSPINIYLAIDVANGLIAQKYETRTLTMEYINE